MPGDQGKIPAWLWLWLPLVLLVGPFLVGFTQPALYDQVFETEFGLVENFQVLFLAFALILALLGVAAARRAGETGCAVWLALFALACFFYLGEEISWGQHFIGWQADGIFAERGQQETNLHNIHPFLSRAPRAILVTAIVIAGAILPFMPFTPALAARLPGGSGFWLWALPAKSCALTAILVLAVKLPKRLLRWTGLEDTHWPGINDNELLEVFTAYFFLLYGILLLRRLKAGMSG